MNNLHKALLIILAIGSLLGSAFAVERYFAKSNDLKLVEMRLDHKIESDRLSEMYDNLIQLRKLCKVGGCVEEDFQKIEKLERDIKEKEAIIDELRKRQLK